MTLAVARPTPELAPILLAYVRFQSWQLGSWRVRMGGIAPVIRTIRRGILGIHKVGLLRAYGYLGSLGYVEDAIKCLGPDPLTAILQVSLEADLH